MPQRQGEVSFCLWTNVQVSATPSNIYTTPQHCSIFMINRIRQLTTLTIIRNTFETNEAADLVTVPADIRSR